MDNQPPDPKPDPSTKVERLQARIQELEAEVVRLTSERDAAKVVLQQSRMARRIPAGRINMNGRDT